MPSFPIIDTHLHLWDPRRMSYSWQRGNTLLDRPYLIEDYARAYPGIEVGGMVFVECDVDSGHFESEVRFVEKQARREGLALIYCHSHPRDPGIPSFSAFDDETEKPLAAFLASCNRENLSPFMRRIPARGKWFSPDETKNLNAATSSLGSRLLNRKAC